MAHVEGVILQGFVFFIATYQPHGYELQFVLAVAGEHAQDATQILLFGLAFVGHFGGVVLAHHPQRTADRHLVPHCLHVAAHLRQLRAGLGVDCSHGLD